MCYMCNRSGKGQRSEVYVISKNLIGLKHIIIGGNRRKDLGYFFIQYELFPSEFNASVFSECLVPAV
jgi:hypothetical protein